MLMMIFNFVFLPMVQDLMHNLDSQFKGKRGRKAYPRTLLLIVVLYCFSENIKLYKYMAKECKRNKYLIIILDGKKPSRNTFANFLNKSDHETIHRVFISTLVLLNEINALSISRVFIDGTDVLIRGFKQYYIKQKDLKAMELVNEWGLLHDGSREEINKRLDELNIKLDEFKDDEEVVKLIKIAKRRIKYLNIMFTIKKIDLKKNLKNEGTLNYPLFFLNQFI